MGHRYYVLFLDDYTNFLWSYPISNKSQVFSVFTTFSNYIATQFERKIKQFQCDNGKEYANSQFQQFCNQNGMHFRFSCPHTSSQNGKAERKIRSINNIIRTLLAQSHLPNTYWHHALEVSTYLLNILPSKLLQCQSPTQRLYLCRPSYDHLRVFGCLCYPLIPHTTIHKLEHRSMSCVFLSYPPNNHGYKCLDLATNKILINRHVIFDETIFPFASQPKPSLHTYEFFTDPLHPIYWPHTHFPNPQRSNPSSSTQPTNSTTTTPHGPPLSSPNNSQTPPTFQPDTQPSLNDQDPTPPGPSNIRTYSRRPRQSVVPPSPPPFHSTFHPAPSSRTIRTRSMDGISKPKQPFNLFTSTITPIPKTPKDALSTPDWYHAMTTEFNALIKIRRGN
ncbi:putative RNA-directed DNA polymerase [Helianthus annuus]|nr:putative RNA-directed DNA polymerase [Helianthus annuus]KAJ0756834.1 putative RNA-directed DNA polymerase [Helianthus annuus]